MTMRAGRGGRGLALGHVLAWQSAAYEQAFDRYRAREFAAALAGFEALAGDPPAAALATRCRQYLSVGSPPAWYGTFVARER